MHPFYWLKWSYSTLINSLWLSGRYLHRNHTRWRCFTFPQQIQVLFLRYSIYFYNWWWWIRQWFFVFHLVPFGPQVLWFGGEQKQFLIYTFFLLLWWRHLWAAAVCFSCIFRVHIIFSENNSWGDCITACFASSVSSGDATMSVQQYSIKGNAVTVEDVR